MSKFSDKARSGFQHIRQRDMFRKATHVQLGKETKNNHWHIPLPPRVKTKVADPIVKLAHNRKFQIFGFIALIVIGIVILLFPQWPRILTLINPPKPDELGYQIDANLPEDKKAALGTIKAGVNAKPIPAENRLVIPKIGVDSEILEWADIYVLSIKEGVWRDNETKDPTQPGNMVIAGHRFQYAPPNTNTFYNLDQLTKGDKIIVFWHGQPYIYEVFDTLTVTPDHSEIRFDDPAVPHELTLYTCTPLYSSAERLVVKAKLLS